MFCTDHATSPTEWLSELGAACQAPDCGRAVVSVDREQIGGVVCRVVTVARVVPAIETAGELDL